MKSTSILSLLPSLPLLPLSLAVALALLGTANASVTVTFIQPDKYADMPFNSRDKENVMADLQKHFDTLGATLPAGQDLKVDVLDIDLAGRIEPSTRLTQDLRILRGSADWPIITLRYSLESQGKVLKSGEERIADMSYLQGYNRYSSGESLRYEKQMIDRWFKKTLVAPKQGG
ncbi:MAG: DUF3016 domain-containing protein [Betaproteobacteria bacterium]|nr:DUF3016 domain-containing protein [Betaproteobacteria bacterium]